MGIKNGIQKITGRSIRDGTIKGVDIMDEVISDIHISKDANISPEKINIIELIELIKEHPNLQNEHIYFETKYSTDWNTGATDNSSLAFINPINIPCILNVNYISYVVDQNGNTNDRIIVGIYNIDGDKLVDTGQQTAARGNYKIPVNNTLLKPGGYFILVKSSNANQGFLISHQYRSNLVPLRGLYNVNSQSATLPNKLNFNSVTNSVNGQPWVILSKY